MKIEGRNCTKELMKLISLSTSQGQRHRLGLQASIEIKRGIKVKIIQQITVMTTLMSVEGHVHNKPLKGWELIYETLQK